ncbi:DUF3820 family protein [Vibrio ulleungensis]|uniref:DUF3820 family protein n=1 Tax=Vibrio ulleungensis TaxID=2807619 RepID=A0ABS2HK39_9VIBR|nr:DUF3820 family protein [Vibrio ulleungensis]MBM7037414.1 DUF3820 family protein [Vibrio ulleungensis]
MLNKQMLIKLAETKMPYGRFAGRPIILLPEEYLLWFANKSEFPKGELGDLMKLSLALKIEGLEKLVYPLLPPETRRS